MFTKYNLKLTGYFLKMRKIIFIVYLFVINNFLFALDRGQKEYFVSPGDLLEISVFPDEEFSREVIVQLDGNISLPLIGNILVTGLTGEKLSKILIRKLSLYTVNPQISISVRRFISVKEYKQRIIED